MASTGGFVNGRGGTSFYIGIGISTQRVLEQQPLPQRDEYYVCA
jgi:hypothetical protein